jgi:chromosome partitioning protein
VESPLTNLDLVPADIRLARFEMQPDYLAHRLTKQIGEHASGYDLVFIDCPPQLGKLLTAALYSAKCVLVPSAADAMGLQGLADLAYTIEQVRKNVNSDLGMLGAVINLYKPQRNLSAESRAAVEAAIALVSHVFDTNLHDYSKIAEAPSQKLPAVYAEKHRAADQLWSLTDEILDRLEMTRNKLTADAERPARARGGKPGTFDFLGFTHYFAKTKDEKRFRMKRVTSCLSLSK